MKQVLIFFFCPIILIAQTQIGDPINAKAVFDFSGSFVSMSSDGSILAVGSPGHDFNGQDSGQIRIFENINNNWIESSFINGGFSEDDFGSSLDISSDGSILAVGAPSSDSNGEDSGQVRLYKNTNGIWSQIGQDINGEAEGDQSGGYISLSSDGTIVAIGAISNDDNGTSSGHVRVYENNNGNWVQIGQDIDGELGGVNPEDSIDGDFSGRWLELSSDGSILAIGAPGNDGNNDSSGHVRVFENNNGTWVQIGEDINGEEGGNFMGNTPDSSGVVSISSDGSILAVGAPFNDGSAEDSGHVRVYENQGGNWVQIGTDIDGEAENDFFGWSLNLNADGSILAVGAIGNDGNGEGSGHARIYENQNGNWTQIGQDIDGENTDSRLGESIHLSDDGTIVAIGAAANNGNGSFAGHTQVYENQGGSWVQIGDDIDAKASPDATGASVDISQNGSYVIIGAPKDDVFVENTGYVWVCQNQGGNWVQVGNDIFGESIGDESGTSVSISSDGSIAAIGASLNDGSGNDSGHVRVFQLDNEQWQQVGEDIDGESAEDESGTSISLSADGTVIAIGAPLNDGGGEDAGHVRVFQLENDEWVQFGNDIDGDSEGGRYGYSISLSGNNTFLVAGAPGTNGNNPGYAKVYENQNSSWTQIGNTIQGESSGDAAGSSVSISSDGSTIAVGAPFNDGNGSDSGHVRIFKNQNNSWIQVGNDINGEAAGDEFGTSVGLSTDGSVLTVGANKNNGNGSTSGHVRVFRYINSNWVQLGSDIDGEAEGDESGTSVGISSDGTKVVIGSPLNDTNGPDSGQVRVFDLSLLLSSDEFVLNNFSLYPNPAKDQFTIELNNPSELQIVNIYNILGQYVLSSVNTTVDTFNMEPGLYFVEIETNKGKATKKLIIN